jgi:hypothetical protein
MFYCSALWQCFRVVAYTAKNFSALLPTTQENVPRCCLQRRSFFRIVGNNTEKCSNFSSCMFFCVVPTTWKNGQRCWQQRGKMLEFNYLHEFETVCEFTLGFQSMA